MSLSDYVVDEPKHKRKIPLAFKALAALFLASIGVLAVGLFMNSHSPKAAGDTSMVELAESLPHEPAWTQPSPKLYYPGKPSCKVSLSTVCGTARNSYRTDRPLTGEDIKRIGTEAGWELQLDENCSESGPNSSANLPDCTGVDVIGDFHVAVSTNSSPDADYYAIEVLVTDLRYNDMPPAL